MEIKTWMENGCKRSAIVPKKKSVAAEIAEVEFTQWFEDFVAKKRVDFSKPAQQLTRPFVIRNVIDDDLNLIKEDHNDDEEDDDDEDGENLELERYNKKMKMKMEMDCLKKKMNDALMK